MKNELAQAYSFLNRGKTAKPLVGISACLCGDRVRYDGREKREPALVKVLIESLDLMNVCPEVAIGMGIPRPPIQLVQSGHKIEARGVKNQQQNPTSDLQGYAQSLIQTHSAKEAGNTLSGFVLKSGSPSCGFGSTPIHHKGEPVALGNGIFAQQLSKQLPWLPIAEELQLITANAQNTFIVQCQLVHDFWQSWQRFKALQPFHQHLDAFFDGLPVQATHKLDELMTNDPQVYLTRLMHNLNNIK